MKAHTTLLQLSRRNLALFLALVCSGFVAVIASSYLLRQAQHEQRQALAQFYEIQGKLAQAGDERQESLRMLTRYQEFNSHGYIGSERRLDWVEQIRKIKTKRKLLDIRYELAPQQSIGGKGGSEIFASNMKLHMQLLHEGDLLNFIDDLRSAVPAYLRIRGCNIERIEPVASSVAQLSAECSIDWITYRVGTGSKS
jgi:hypothetical protein